MDAEMSIGYRSAAEMVELDRVDSMVESWCLCAYILLGWVDWSATQEEELLQAAAFAKELACLFALLPP
ncbi:hypothetical protein GUJ93_ZPchr0006g44572 [Zizania palustris]|uniref:Uncharacterized protein n=1 Tax=Zizania palustris TaxID=103762 RepID=A0A8J5T3S9_ZIZPA|nr:hypothetical protein GUJ93_ZPchr0006g44572 [Zizania palustris]